jgi:hypothetical protein
LVTLDSNDVRFSGILVNLKMHLRKNGKSVKAGATFLFRPLVNLCLRQPGQLQNSHLISYNLQQIPKAQNAIRYIDKKKKKKKQN